MMIMGSFKNPKKSKWFMVCFRPIEESLKSKKGGSQESNLRQKILFAGQSNKTDSCPDNNDGWKSRRRRFPRVFKAIFSNTASSLSKKKRNKKSGKDPSRSGCNISSKFEKIFNTSSEKKSKSLLSSSDSVSSRSSLFSSTLGSSMRSPSSSSSISSMVSNSRTGSERKQTYTADLKELKPNNKPVSPKKTKMEEGGNLNAEIGLYFMLICLIGLIFWGKAFAIFCTSTCLFLVPCIFKRVDFEENDVDFIDIDSDEYKKKVVMEGLIDRNRTIKL